VTGLRVKKIILVKYVLICALLTGMALGTASAEPEELARTKPHVNVGIIGSSGHGKTALTAAIDKIMAAKHGGAVIAFDEIENAPEDRMWGIRFATAHVEYESANRHYAHVDWPQNADYVKSMITGAAQMDGAILIVSATEGTTSQTREQIELARRSGVRHIVVYLNKADVGNDEEMLVQVEMETRNLLLTSGFPVEDPQLVIGSATKALEGEDGEYGTQSVVKLVDAMDSYIPEPEQAKDGDFLMPVEDVFSISGRGTVVTGRIERGVVKVGDEIEIVGIRDTGNTTIKGVEMFRKILDEGQAGDNVGVLLDGIKRAEVERGQVLAKPGSITPHTRFEADVYLLTKDEGGRHKPFSNGYRPQFYFRTTDVTGVVELPEGVEMVMPGDNVQMTVELIEPIAMEDGLRFAIREGGRTVGAGVVSRIIGEYLFPDSELRAPTWSEFQDVTRAFVATPEPKRFLDEVRTQNEDLAETLLLFKDILKAQGHHEANMQRIYTHYVINTGGDLPTDDDQDAYDVVKWVEKYADSLQIEISEDKKRLIRGDKDFSWRWDYESGADASLRLRNAGLILNRARYGRNDVIPATLFPFNKDASGHTKPNAMWMAELSALAYHDEEYVEQQLRSWEYRNFRWITSPESQNTDTVAFLATGRDYAVISFRGTSSRQNLWTDLKFSKVTALDDRGKVHKGFMQAYASIHGALTKAVNEVAQDRALFVTGHSLGAALAQLAAYELAKTGKNVAAVYVFGSPRVGDEDFARAYNEQLEGQTFLHINNKDAVARVPPQWLFFRSLGNPTNHFAFDGGHWLSNEMTVEDAAPDGIQFDDRGEVILTDNVEQRLRDSKVEIENIIHETTRYLDAPVDIDAPDYAAIFETGPADDHGINQYLFKFACSIVDDKWSRM